MNQKLDGMDLRELLFTFRKHLRLILVSTILLGLTGFTLSKFVIRPTYQSDALMIVNAKTNSQNSTVTYDQITTAQQLVGTYAIILKSDTVLDKVIKNLELSMDARELAGSITVNGVNSTEVLDITVKSKDPVLAKNIANEITRVAPDIIINTVKAGSVEIISPAKAGGKPVSPNVPLNTVIAALAGLILSVLAAFVAELLNNTFSTDDDIQKVLGFSVLGVIPYIDGKAEIQSVKKPAGRAAAQGGTKPDERG